MQGHSFSPEENVYLLYDQGTAKPLGTCFPFAKEGTFLTAAHVVSGTSREDLRIVAHNGSFVIWLVTDVVPHPDADVAILKTAGGRGRERFKIGRTPQGAFPQAEPVLSCGYALRTDADEDEPVFVLRTLHGHIQRYESNNGGGGEFGRYELSYPSFVGNSGSPVLLQDRRNEAIAVVTHGYTFSSTPSRLRRPPAAGRTAGRRLLDNGSFPAVPEGLVGRRVEEHPNQATQARWIGNQGPPAAGLPARDLPVVLARM